MTNGWMFDLQLTARRVSESLRIYLAHVRVSLVLTFGWLMR
jgi:hypothetical protein